MQGKVRSSMNDLASFLKEDELSRNVLLQQLISSTRRNRVAMQLPKATSLSLRDVFAFFPSRLMLKSIHHFVDYSLERHEFLIVSFIGPVQHIRSQELRCASQTTFVTFSGLCLLQRANNFTPQHMESDQLKHRNSNYVKKLEA
jgi:hypothetical protein